MEQFKPLKELRERIWPLAVTKDLATDMTGVSLPILDFTNSSSPHPYQAIFLLYYAVPGINEADKITHPYALMALDLKTGELVKAEGIKTENSDRPLIGPGVSQEVYELAGSDRRNLQNLFFARCDEAAQLYSGGRISAEQTSHLADLISLYESLSEPPLATDYDAFGKPFFSWLQEKSKIAKK